MQEYEITLTPEEQAVLRGEQGETLRKVMQTVVMYGEAFGAEKLVPIQGSPHLVTSFGANTIKPYFNMMTELIDAGLKTQQPFTVDPRPMDFENLDPGLLRRLSFKLIFGKQEEYERQLEALGSKTKTLSRAPATCRKWATRPNRAITWPGRSPRLWSMPTPCWARAPTATRPASM